MIIKDNTFFNRLKAFIQNAQVNDLPSQEEKEYFLELCEEMIVLQKYPENNLSVFEKCKNCELASNTQILCYNFSTYICKHNKKNNL